ncbi:OmpH family outer membrane protein [Salipiger sp.]|uniref:OmpH family outer membrane protein n=1 Tax=Salipiger sp. TaxID=2078585 RepID=UPI003A97F3D2
MRHALRLALVAACLAVAGQGQAQEAMQPGVVQSPILTLEFDRVYADSAFGRHVADVLEAEGAEIVAENRRIEAELGAEEKSLTAKRATLPPGEFRALADAFDEKVQKLRREQDTKARALGNRSDDLRRQFLAAIEPVLGEMMRESGAAVVLEKRSVFLSAGVIDVTDTAIARIDAEIGDGAELISAPGTAAPVAPDGAPAGPTNPTFPTGTPVPEE